MKVAVIQTKPVFGERGTNICRALNMMRSVEADLYVLPELFSTGYLFTDREELSRLAEPVMGAMVAGLFDFTRARGSKVFAGLAELDGDRIFNSSVLVSEGRVEAVYRKLHLFINEKNLFDPADNAPLVYETTDAKLGLMICFDWIFPEMARALTLKGAQVLCCVANLVLPWCQEAMITRSLENGVFSVLANRIGTEERGGQSLTFTGGSRIVSPRGEILAQASPDEEEVICAEFDPDEADDKMLTATNHLLNDRRVDIYGK